MIFLTLILTVRQLLLVSKQFDQLTGTGRGDSPVNDQGITDRDRLLVIVPLILIAGIPFRSITLDSWYQLRKLIETVLASSPFNYMDMYRILLQLPVQEWCALRNGRSIRWVPEKWNFRTCSYPTIHLWNFYFLLLLLLTLISSFTTVNIIFYL